MKIVIIEITNVTPHLETSLELAKLHLDKGDSVLYFYLGNSVSFRDFVFTKGRYTWRRPERKGAKLIRSEKFHYYEPKKCDLKDVADLPNFINISDLMHYRYKGYNVGLSALSSLISITNNSNPDIEGNIEIIKKIICSGISIYKYSLKVFREKKPDVVYLFNGRFANNRAILDAAIETKTNYLIHERGADKTRYSVRPYMPHDFAKIKKDILSVWHGFDSINDKIIAESFFINRRKGKEQATKSYIANQQKGLLLKDIEIGRKVIAYFSSSDDEYAAVGDIVKWDRWHDQSAAVKELISIVGKNASLELAIRIHPHMSEKSSADLQRWVQLELPKNVYLIMPDDPVDTYALIENSSIVVTSGSTVGIEAVFWGTPSICLGPSLYSNLDAVYLPNNNVELELMLLGDSLDVKPERALPYGYYMAIFGEKFIHYQPDTLFSGRFMGVNLQSFGLCKYLRKGRSIISRVVRIFRNQPSVI